MVYGLVDAELVETSPSIYEQTVGTLRLEMEGMSIAYIRNIGSKTVEITGVKKKLNVLLSLDDKEITGNNEILKICELIASNCPEAYSENIIIYLDKMIHQAVKEGHGNLIGVVNTQEGDKLDRLKEKLKDGEYLLTPINIGEFIIANTQDKTNASSVALRAYSSVIMSMLNHDGITLMNTEGVVIGYHIFIESISKEDEQLIGGARTRAFQSMVNSELFEACFYKSQDGNSKIWIKDDE